MLNMYMAGRQCVEVWSCVVDWRLWAGWSRGLKWRWRMLLVAFKRRWRHATLPLSHCQLTRLPDDIKNIHSLHGFPSFPQNQRRKTAFGVTGTKVAGNTWWHFIMWNFKDRPTLPLKMKTHTVKWSEDFPFFREEFLLTRYVRNLG